jgi:predicted RNA-binding Zn-ribbon protein involved in translation (DUF1610 family)
LVKTTDERNAANPYEMVGFCSDKCFYEFWDKVLEYPADDIIGTDVQGFNSNWVKLWNAAIVNAFTNGKPYDDAEIVSKVQRAIRINSDRCVAFPWINSSGAYDWTSKALAIKAKTALAENLERCGRTLDSAKIFEDLRLYDKARTLRQKEKHIIVKRTDVTVDLNALLNQVKNGALIIVFRCPNCGGKVKIDKSVSIDKLRICEHCGSEIETVDLADFLRTALS